MCRRRAPKPELLRWVVVDGVPVPDARGREPGRGRYVCRVNACLDGLGRRFRGVGWDFNAASGAFRLAIGEGLVENVPGELHEN